MNGYLAPKWLPGRHVQTILPALFCGASVQYERERWTTPDGADFIDVDWAGEAGAEPLVVLFHGLEGSSASGYARRIGRAVVARNWRYAVAHFRGCSGELNRQLRDYHAGSSDEIDWILRRAAQKHRRVFAVGVSLGANALLKWLGEQGAAAGDIVSRAVAISAPFELSVTGAALARGFSLFYSWWFLQNRLRYKAMCKLPWFPGAFDARCVKAVTALRDYEDAVTAPVNGFRDVDDYWARSSAGQFLSRIGVPTLLINARNDPFLGGHVLSGAEAMQAARKIPTNVVLDFQPQGGHAGFADGRGWLGKRVLRFLADE